MKHKDLAMAVAGIGIVAASNGALAYQQFHPEHMMSEAGWFIGPFMMVFALLVIVAIAFLIVRWLWPTSSSVAATGGPKTAIQLLEERFARGEIEKGEFEDRKRVIGG